MNEMKFTTEINASKEKVWDTLWQDATFREWAGLIDPGTHLVGELKEGNEIQFISGNGYGVTSLVETLKPYELLVLRHNADTQDEGKNERAKEWTGGAEKYMLTENDGITTLVTTFDVPTELEKYFQIHYPKALTHVKTLAENR